MLYNALWTSLTCLFAYALEKDLDDRLSIHHAKDIYPAGPKQQYFNYFIFWKWVGFSLWHGLVTFFFVTASIPVFFADQEEVNAKRWRLSVPNFARSWSG